MPNLLQRLRARFRNRHFDADLAEELRLHEELKREELERAGIPPGDARREARRALGNVSLMREESRGVWIGPWIESIGQDAKYALRALLRQPLHSLTAITVLTLAIGMLTTIFTIVKKTAYAPWPAKSPHRIVRIWATNGTQHVGPSVDEYRFVREHATTLSGVAAYFFNSGARIQTPGRSETISRLQLVSANFLDVMGARISLGSGLLPEDDLPAAQRAVVVVSDHLWRSYMNADPQVVGQLLTVNGKPYIVVGVLEPAFDGLDRPVDLWMPLSAASATNVVSNIGLSSPASANCCISMVARLADGVSHARARQEIQVLHERLLTANLRKTGTVAVFGTAYADMPGRNDLDTLPIVALALGMLLVLACANVGNLQLARGLSRRREIATRVAIGAGRSRLIRQMLIEGLVLAAIAGIVALFVAAMAPTLMLRVTGLVVSAGRGNFNPDWQVVAFTAAVCTVACLVFALAPALHATRSTIPLGSLDRSSTRRARVTLRGGFLAAQIALCTVLLVAAGLVTRAIAHAMSFDPGFRVEGVQRVSVFLPSETPSPNFERELLAALEREADEPVASSHPGPFTDFPFEIGIALPGEAAKDHRQVPRRSISRRYFEVLSIPMLRGRMFASDAKGEIVVNEAFIRTFLEGREGLGETMQRIDDKGAVAGTLTVVGVVKDAYLTGLEHIRPVVFSPTTAGVLITSGGPATIAQIRATARGLNPSASVRVWPLSEDIGGLLKDARNGATIAWTIGLLGLALACVGVIGVFAYAVEERRREIGLRIALGARRTHIIAMLIDTGGRGLVIGLGTGLLLSLAGGSLLRSYLFGLSPIDPIAYAGVTLLLVTAAALATLVPARRACGVDPAITLRED